MVLGFPKHCKGLEEEWARAIRLFPVSPSRSPRTLKSASMSVVSRDLHSFFSDHIEQGMMGLSAEALQALCIKHSLAQTGTKLEMVRRIRDKLNMRKR